MISGSTSNEASASTEARPLRAYAEESLELSVEEFVERYPFAVFLYSTISSGAMTPVGKTKTPTVDRLVVGDTPSGVKPISAEDWYLVYELRSQGSGRTSLGCSSACDVTFNDTSVSRMHAWLIRAQHGAYIEDADSSAGTAVNGKTLVPGEPVALSSSDRVSLGNVDLIYLPPQDLYTFVRRLAGGWDR